ncbi:MULTISPECIES: hypothetical protein [Mycolicibacterium]|jgi:hypothetical protein|uniref:Conserved lipoprotein LppK n=2 Tax=Mycolicibacterium TaxID=1866885 RepID=A1TAQ5_MYCVP|nr:MULTISPECIES: hypothetical protein [Mycolicibacterium]ABM14255.1 putative conserved lipoprotein LppK [Mycolicibacterium vanbaalenii PYR-1]MDN4519921.1 hypothetical protein [Mycolicibacterium austroafricanum]MDW5613113.1 hypothetical protein [Mycolicibacterium sp. D5.8-2]PQP38957.1 hypothetical protein C6A88_34375 [Mycolicibacterium austroafricanum]WND54553.1 hypothetical protein QQA43_17365 [Mycolicibacterium vanbaalenii]
MVRSAVTFVAALGLCGCNQNEHPAATAPSPAPPAVESSAPAAPIPDSPGGPPLPPPDALIGVMARLSDPAVPGDQKITLIENASQGEAAGLDRFAVALRDNGSLPLTFEARDLAWSQSEPGNVVATIVITPANPPGGQFTYPMEFAPSDGSWQLTRQTADLLLQLDDPAPSPPR